MTIRVASHRITVAVVGTSVVLSQIAAASGPKEVGEPPALPRFPQELAWDRVTKGQLEWVNGNYPVDQVSAYMKFSQLLNSENMTDPKQRAWLEGARDLLRSHVETVLEHDYHVALASADLRGAVVADQVLSKIRGEKPEERLLAILQGLPELMTAVKHAFDGDSARVWEITEVQAKRMNQYTESFQTGYFPRSDRTITIKPVRESLELVHVTAKVRNVSSSSDPPYVHWGLPDPIVSLLHRDYFQDGMDPCPPKASYPQRLATPQFLFLGTDAGWCRCLHVCMGKFLKGYDPSNTLLGGNGFFLFEVLGDLKAKHGTRTDEWTSVATYCPGRFAKQGAEFSMSVLFSVPKGAKGLRLFFLGSPPVLIPE